MKGYWNEENVRYQNIEGRQPRRLQGKMHVPGKVHCLGEEPKNAEPP